jgi:hypothetical protein
MVHFGIWGGDRDAIRDRLFFLLHNKPEKFIASTDFRIVYARYNWTSPDIYDNDLELYWNEERYLFRAVKLVTDVS